MTVVLRWLAAADLAAAFPIIVQLRTHLDHGEFLRRCRIQVMLGYRLLGAFDGDDLIGVGSTRPVCTLARGMHAHVDDLVVDAKRRGSGIGKLLLEGLEADARSAGQESVFLDSRPEVLGFYSRLGYAPHTATLVRKRL